MDGLHEPVSVSKMTKTPVVLLGPDGTKEFLLAPLEPSELGELEQWVRNKPIKVFKERIEELGDMLTPDERLVMLRVAMDESTKSGSLTEPKAQVILNSIEGLQFVLLLMLRKNHPDLKYEDVRPLLTADNILLVKAKIDEANNLKSGEGPGGNSSRVD